jgi:hypothetical protein
MQPFGLLSDNRYSSDDPRFALNYAGGGVTGETPTNADALGRLAYGLTNLGGVQDAAGLLGGPSLRENVSGGNYLDAAMQGVGVLPVVGGVAKGLLGAGALYKAAKMGAPEIKAALDPSVVRMFLGPGAKTADKAALAEAEALHSSGASREDIIDKTGWFKGVDGNWRFEVPDNNSVFMQDNMPKPPNRLELAERYFTENGVPATKLSTGQFPDLDKAAWAHADRIIASSTPTSAFSDVLQHRGLFDNYDGVGDYRVAPELTAGVGGSFDRGSKRLTLYNDRLLGESNAAMADRKRSTLLHEGQHTVQEIEDFARGGSPNDPSLAAVIDESKISDWRKTYKENADFARDVDLYNSNQHNYAISASNRLYSDNYAPRLQELAKKFSELPRGQSEEKQSIRDAMTAIQKEYDIERRQKFPIVQAVEEANANWMAKKGLSLFEPQNNVLEPREAYRRLAGEVEARTTQKRMDMTADERKARYPWLDYDVPEDQQIVRFRGLLGP